MDKQKIVNFFKESIKKELENKHGGTYWYTLGEQDEKDIAIVLGWQDGFDTEDGYELCMKLAYTSNNNVMREYDIDWIMPFDKDTGEVDDMEVSITGDNLEDVIDWLLKCYERYSD